jgi:hypothetical protein
MNEKISDSVIIITAIANIDSIRTILKEVDFKGRILEL